MLTNFMIGWIEWSKDLFFLISDLQIVDFIIYIKRKGTGKEYI